MKRDFDIVVWGATGFTGRLIAEYLARNASPDVRWALGGRSREKLEGIARDLPSGRALRPELVVADAANAEQMNALAARSRVVCSAVGPFARYGMPLVLACAENGTDYCDTTGEVHFMRRSIDAADARAKATGARIVHAVGFDSIPSDLGVLLLAEHARKQGATLGETELVLLASKGGASGGTVATMLAMVDEAKKDRALRKLMADPYALSPDRKNDLTNDGYDALGIELNRSLGLFTAPFFMGPTNTRVVRRSNALTGFRYGRSFRYRERMVASKAAKGLPGALLASVGIGALLGLASIPVTRKLLEARVPKPGEGPSRQERETGFFKIAIFAALEGQKRPSLRAEVIGTNDPGYGETAKMVGESTLALLDDGARQPGFEAGVLTSATALGMPLIERLRGAGMTFSAREMGEDGPGS